jgi:hypothetical protein
LEKNQGVLDQMMVQNFVGWFQIAWNDLLDYLISVLASGIFLSFFSFSRTRAFCGFLCSCKNRTASIDLNLMKELISSERLSSFQCLILNVAFSKFFSRNVCVFYFLNSTLFLIQFYHVSFCFAELINQKSSNNN